MKLPNHENVVIERLKIEGYLLALDHSIGYAKAKFFIEVGYSKDNWQVLKEDIWNLAQSMEVRSAKKTLYGSKYVIDGVMLTPSGRAINIRTIWILEKDGEVPRFVTAFPR